MWPRYVLDPASVSGLPHAVVAALIAAVMFFSFAALTFLVYCLLLGGGSETNKKFTAAVLNRAAIGAALGALLGVRLAPAVLGPGLAAFPSTSATLAARLRC